MDTRAATSQPLHRMITEPLTWAEIWEYYPGQNLVLVDVEGDTTSGRFHTARVIGAGYTMAAACRQAALWRIPFQTTCLFSTQQPPEDAIVLPFQVEHVNRVVH